MGLLAGERAAALSSLRGESMDTRAALGDGGAGPGGPRQRGVTEGQRGEKGNRGRDDRGGREVRVKALRALSGTALRELSRG